MDWIIIGGLLIIIVMQILLRPKQLNNNKEDLEKLLNEIQRSFDRIEKNFREDFRLNREESRLVAKDNREELAHSMNEFREAFERGIDSFNRLQKEKFAALDERQQRLVDNTEKTTGRNPSHRRRETSKDIERPYRAIFPFSHRTIRKCTKRTGRDANLSAGCRRVKTGT